MNFLKLQKETKQNKQIKRKPDNALLSIQKHNQNVVLFHTQFLFLFSQMHTESVNLK